MRDLIAQQGRLIAEQSVLIQELSSKVAVSKFTPRLSEYEALASLSRIFFLFLTVFFGKRIARIIG